jgi:hypothetical protein
VYQKTYDVVVTIPKKIPLTSFLVTRKIETKSASLFRETAKFNKSRMPKSPCILKVWKMMNDKDEYGRKGMI